MEDEFDDEIEDKIIEKNPELYRREVPGIRRFREFYRPDECNGTI